MYSTATTIAGVCPLTDLYSTSLVHTKESSVTPLAILTQTAPTSSLRAVFLSMLPQTPCFQKQMETIQVPFRVRDLKTLSPCAD